MKTKIKKIIWGILAAGSLLATVGTASAESCSITEKISIAATIDENTHDLGNSNQYKKTETHFLVPKIINGTEVLYTGFTTEDKLANTLIAGVANGMTINISSANCEPQVLVAGKAYRVMGQVRYAKLTTEKKPEVSKKQFPGNLKLQK